MTHLRIRVGVAIAVVAFIAVLCMWDPHHPSRDEPASWMADIDNRSTLAQQHRQAVTIVKAVDPEELWRFLHTHQHDDSISVRLLAINAYRFGDRRLHERVTQIADGDDVVSRMAAEVLRQSNAEFEN